MTRLPISLVLLGVLSISASLWFGLPMTGIPELASPWVRAGCIIVSLGSIAAGAAQRAQWRRRAAQSLEATLIGDGAILAERMKSALSRLKQTEGATSLYDLPWYVLIGPPGAGKTTALLHSGLTFPGTDATAVAGFGGTRNCDFWFSEEAVLIDTAGRYTTQDSDAQADKASWLAFLQELKDARPHQPINGVILSLSCEDIMNAADESLDAHAQAVRDRLSEVHEALRIDVPVYVLFTKADLISGFRAFFGSYGAARRNSVWGVTFQTRDRAEDTWQAVPMEFDQLVARLSDEVTDRMNLEPDTASRISVFGFPGQMGLMRRNVSEFLRRVFEDRQQTRAILRGFYFTSGTQEGTPIDQVLGAMAGPQGGIQPAFLSGKGRSYFQHDLFKKVIFAERHWVGYDNRTLRWRSVFRAAFTGLIAVVTAAVLVTFGYSFWQNATLVRQAAAGAQIYRDIAQPVLQQTVITDASTRPILPALNAARDIPTGYANPLQQPMIARIGLSRHTSLRHAALGAYSEALELLLRPRMMLLLENTLPRFLAAGDSEAVYRTLKVYLLLAKQQGGQGDDLAIQKYFSEAWGPEYSASGQDAAYREINEHLAAMLALDGRVNPLVKPDRALVERARAAIVDLSPAQQVYGTIVSDAATLHPFRLMDEFADTDATVAFRTTDGRPLQSLVVPGLYTQGGYWGFFRDAQSRAAEIYMRDRWVLGAVEPDDLDTVIADLGMLYRAEFGEAWTSMLNRIDVAPGTTASQLGAIVEVVDRETRLAGFLDTLEATPEVLVRGEVGRGDDQKKLLQGAGAQLLSARPDGAEFDAAVRRQAEEIGDTLASWHRVHGTGAAALNLLAERVSSNPMTFAPLVQDLDAQMQNAAAAPMIAAYNADLNKEIEPLCNQYILDTFPFSPGSSRQIPLAEFGQFFGFGGRMQRLFDTHLQDHTDTSAGGSIVPRRNSVLAARLSPDTLSSFRQAQRIRTLFFPVGSDMPFVQFSIALTESSESVEAARLEFGERIVELSEQSGSTPVTWPEDVVSISIGLQPDTGSSLKFERADWSILDFIASGRLLADPAVLEVTHVLEDQSVTFRLDFQGEEIPFLTQDFVDFTCPKTLE